MTIEEFMINYNIKNKKKILNWISEDLIPGANIKNNYVPNSARPPYTKARAKNSQAIYHSIVLASSRRYHVLPKIYRICEDEFNGYIKRLVEANLISVRVTDDITYYDATMDIERISKYRILKIIEACSIGVTTAVINQISR